MLQPVTDAGRAGLAALRADPARALVAVDYDGTLAPVVQRPEDARPAPGAVEALHALAGTVGTLAVVTGRAALVVLALAGLDGVPGLVVLGQYGAERWDGALVADPAAPGLDDLRTSIPPVLEGRARLEDKGLSLVVHGRGLPDPEAELARLRPLLERLAAPYGLQVHPGRLVLEVRPAGHDKGRALRGLADPAPSAVLFAGDDVGDLPAFDAVAALRAEGVPGLTVCSASDEGPPALRERADLVVDGPPGVVRLLEELAR